MASLCIETVLRYGGNDIPDKVKNNVVTIRDFEHQKMFIVFEVGSLVSDV